MPAGTSAPHRVTVLGSFTLHVHHAPVPLGVDARRVVAYLAVHPRPQRRAALAVDLWPGVPVAAAMRLLDDAVLAVDVPGLLVTDADGALSLGPDVEVDLAGAMALLRTLPDVPAAEDPDLALLAADILPGWTAAWLVVERERFRQLRLHATEERSLRLTAAARYDEAVALAQQAVHAAPSRESARRALIEAHLAQGNIAAAVAEYDEYQELLRSSVGAAPAFALDALMPPSPAWPVMRARSVMPRSAVQLPGLRSVRASGSTRRLVAGGSVPGTFR
ncbi:AfsR/SARP family transcriptional regulator [Pseudonocardia broussonetiae]|uniref:SARP family transcriptional regulator n=1 Tax=Pseudonocardia broussonetiae TaxID=2736640 RepID=A0A6M6JMZ1_9PSEU|nr:BTAD domain-containing putative transcriptional regulator [Pseudonocardia broussonetiae]QJY48706.1 SARP family transcriptional regulator [Pseudonocardia broussonetiae]